MSLQGPDGSPAAAADLPDYPILCGLANLGNTCFANSAIQIASAATPFVTALRYGPGTFYDDMELQKQFRDLTRYSTVRHQVWKATTALLERMQLAESPFVAPSAMLQSVAILNDRFAMGAGQQHDSVEWLSTWVDALDETFQVDLNAAPMADALDAAVRDLPATPALQRAQAVASTLRSIDATNDAEELRLKRRKSPHVVDSGYAPPRLHRSPVGDVFRGMQVTAVTCGTCATVSRTATEFTSLQLAFPTDADRASYAALKERENQPAADGKSDSAAAASARRRSHGPSNGVLSTVSGAVALALGGFLSGMRWIWCCVGGGCCRDYGPLTLDEVLWAHFQPVRLTGDERYRCHSDKCQGELRDATKTIRILTFPEVLLVQLKRFEYGAYWTSKIAEHVTFPLDFTTASGALPAGSAPITSDGVTPALDLAPFALDPAARTAPVVNSTSGAAAAAPPTNVTAPTHSPPISGAVSSYSLAGVVNHHGSFFGGHYTAFCSREEDDTTTATMTTRFWALHNDERTGAAAPERVADSQAYVLAYRKRPVDAVANGAAVPSAPEVAAARALLKRDTWRDLGTRAMGNSNVRFVPRAWLVRLAAFTEPGPIITRPCYCTEQRRMTQCFVHGGEVSDTSFPPVRQAPAEGGYVDRSNRHFHAPCRWAYAPVDAEVYDAWERKFGSDGPAIDGPAMLRLQQAEMRWRGALETAHIAGA